MNISNRELEKMLDLDIHELELVRKTILNQACSLKFEMSGPNWQKWYEEMHADRDNPKRYGPRIEEDNFWDFQKSCYHTLLARYIVAEEPKMIAETRAEIREIFGKVDEGLLIRIMPDIVDAAKEWITAIRSMFNFAQEVIESSQNESSRGKSRDWNRQNSY